MDCKNVTSPLVQNEVDIVYNDAKSIPANSKSECKNSSVVTNTYFYNLFCPAEHYLLR